MKKWCIIDNMISKGSLEEITVLNSKEEALAEAEKKWNNLTILDKKSKDSYIVGLCNVEEFKPNCWQYAEDENGNIDADIYEIAKKFEV